MPFVFDKYLSNKEYGNDYNLMLARPYLDDIENNRYIVLTNIGNYTYYYYANSIKMPDVSRPDLPVFRKKPEIIYTNRLISTNRLKDNMGINFICQNRISYVFYVHTDGEDMLNNYIANLPYLVPVKEYYLSESGRFNWGLYAVDNTFCNK
jgi:hypothetical protein